MWISVESQCQKKKKKKEVLMRRDFFIESQSSRKITRRGLEKEFEIFL